MNLSVIGIQRKRVTFVCNKIKVVMLKLHKTSGTITSRNKVIFDELTQKFATVKGQLLAQNRMLKCSLSKHGRGLCKLMFYSSTEH